jgi:methyltransferase (TIGR00027 family)
MTEREASRTALGTAYLRAAHQLLDAPPRILDDPIALQLLGQGAAQHINAMAEHYHTPGAQALRAHVVLRSRFAEDRLAAAVGRGITQYVMLGAGFDTFALRQPAWAKSLKILEVDHPGTQSVKRTHLAQAGLEVPANTALAHIDFEHEALLDGLLRHHISLKERTFFTWLGVTMYLCEAAIETVLLSIAAFPPGSEIVLTFLEPPDSRSHAAQEALTKLAQRVDSVGEPFVSYFEPAAIEKKLCDAGFTKVEFLLPAEAEARYFNPRPKDLPIPQTTGIVCAIR